MEKLKQLEEKLKNRPASQLDIMDFVTEKMYQKAVNQIYLDKNHGGSLPAYLQALQDKGLQKIQLYPRLKNGSSSKADGPAVTVDFTSGSSTPQNNGPSAPASPQTQMPNFGLAGAYGLGMPEIMDGYAAKRENEMLKEQIRQLHADLKEEKESKRKYRDRAEKFGRENERYEYKEDIQREPSALDKIISSLAENPSSIPALIGAFKGVGGLNSPQPQPQEAQIIDTLDGYSDMQRVLCETIGQLPDGLCEDIATMIARIGEEDKVFIKELKKLLESSSLKKVEDG